MQRTQCRLRQRELSFLNHMTTGEFSIPLFTSGRLLRETDFTQYAFDNTVN
jgi:hypothetical protein